jgi:hypothetical protein
MILIIAVLVIILSLILSMKNVRSFIAPERYGIETREQEMLIEPKTQQAGGLPGRTENIDDSERKRLLDLLALYQTMAPDTAGPNSDYMIAFAQKTGCRQNVQAINNAVEAWHVVNSQWPRDDLGDISRDRNFFPNGIPPCPVDGSIYRLDPRSHRVLGHTHPEIPDIKSPYDVLPRPR